jgi:FkbM family methyltransferase
MQLSSRAALLLTKLLPRGYARVLRAAALRDPYLRELPIRPRSLSGATLIADLRESVFIGIFRFGCIHHQMGLEKLLAHLLRDGDVVYDVGANIGYMTLWFASTRKDIRVYAFEPSKKALKYLQRNIASNASLQSKIHVQEVALSSSPGELDFYEAAQLDVSSLYVQDSVSKYGVRATTIDRVANETDWPTIIKIDVEGHEANVLAGAQLLLASERAPIIIFEALTQVALHAVLAWLPKERCRQVYRISADGKLLPPDSEIGSSDYLVMPAWAQVRLSFEAR